ncbi:MAG: ABC transporter substrate-binding protein [Alphaproteobacteria bacterium]|nr:ABC transporter substrate-binding protein [Alphaproteobacteria bacterium]
MTTLNRRAVLAGAAAVPVAGAARAQRRDPKELRFISAVGLTVLDPIWTASLVTLNHAYHVYDTLYGIGQDLSPRPQMVAGHTVSDDGREWRFTLREGLWFHDGTPVLARDAVASIKRWAKRDSFGQLIAEVLEGVDAPDDRTFRFKLKKAFPHLLVALSRVGALACFVMPERFANTDAYTAVKDATGSGPYRFLADEFNAGSRAAYARFDKYVPRAEKAERTAGGKVAHFERVTWYTMPDSATAANAMQSGEMDWWEYTPADLHEMLRKAKGITVQAKDPYNWYGIARFNLTQAPFNNKKLRRAVLAAVNQEDFMRAGFGDDQEVWRTCRAMMPCGVKDVEEFGQADMPALSVAAARKLVAESGYNGERTVVIAPVDYPQLGAFGTVMADLLKRIGMNVDFQPMDWGTMIQRVTSREPVEKGGWSMFHTSGSKVSMINPALNMYVRGQGAKGWTGWYDKPEIEALTQQWLDSPAEGSARELFSRYQRVLFEDPPLVPLGQYGVFTVRRNEITGILDGSASYPWNVRRV